jgi:2-oxoglutarate dehydrogenase E1 component
MSDARRRRMGETISEQPTSKPSFREQPLNLWTAPHRPRAAAGPVLLDSEAPAVNSRLAATRVLWRRFFQICYAYTSFSGSPACDRRYNSGIPPRHPPCDHDLLQQRPTMSVVEAPAGSRPSSRPSSSQPTDPSAENGHTAALPGGGAINGSMGIGVDTSNLSYVEELYQQYTAAPASVTPEWRDYFSALSRAAGENSTTAQLFRPAREMTGGLVTPVELDASIFQERVDQLIRNYRAMGHYVAQLDPLGRPRPEVTELNPASCGFTEADLDRHFSTQNASGPNLRTLREILQWLRNTYCRSIGAQFMHIDDIQVREWLQQRMEATENRISLKREEQLRILKRLNDAVVFEKFIQTKFQGKKTFSLEGAETLIPLLDEAIYCAADQGVSEIVIGMAHRGRLNVLSNIMGKPPKAIFREFADMDPQLHVGRGDVKYHLGYSNDWHSGDGKTVHLSLCFNPSHLEFVNPVAMGRVRAKQDRMRDEERGRVMLLLIHGDAAFSGEGVVQETLNINALASTKIGGTVHVIVNNQVGFTTDPEQGRSTPYCSDVAKMLQIPIFHVNGEDPEAVAQVVKLALEFRQEFKQDVVIDMYCYRRRGHNEQDEPEFTQPQMYAAIKSRKDVAESYFEHISKLGSVTRDDADRFVLQYRQQLESELEVARSTEYVHRWDMLRGVWVGQKGGLESGVEDVSTGVPVDTLRKVLTQLSTLPDGFHAHTKIFNPDPNRRLDGVYQVRAKMASGSEPLDWGTAEALAFATLALEGYRIRVHGQDCERGTFSHRQAVVRDVQTGQKYCSLQHLSPDQAPVEIFNSALSETGCLGFDYGYSLDCPDGLICWEAQFGDFVNAAQVIIDQFISSAEDKWNRLSGLVMLLPHGFEGAGPEHSSARLERFLQIAAEDNIQVVYPTTPAQMFHLLRRQMLKKWRKPLVVMTPKWMLRYKESFSSMDQLATGTFQRVIGDQADLDPANVRQVVLCSGKVYYDLVARRAKVHRRDVAILRIEQLYPLPKAELETQLSKYPAGTPVVWVQEEPENMGAWWFLRVNLGESILKTYPLSVISRPASASPATGSTHSHEIEQDNLVSQVVGSLPEPR